MVFFKTSLEQLNTFMCTFDKGKFESSLNSFNANQSDENDLIKDVLSRLPPQRVSRGSNVRTDSNLYLNQTPPPSKNEQYSFQQTFQTQSNLNFFNNITHLAPMEPNKNLSRSSLVKSYDNLSFQPSSTSSQPSSHPFSSHFISNSKLDLSSNRSNRSISENGASKIGYLFKKTHNSKVRKYWIRRKCMADNGFFIIYHSDVCFFLKKILYIFYPI